MGGRTLNDHRCAAAGVVVSVMVFSGCGVHKHPPTITGPGIYHVVRPGQNLYRIGKAYGISHRELARVNGIENPDRLEIGQRIYVPGSRRALPVNVITPEGAVADLPELREFPSGEGIFIWPLATGTVTSAFGPRGQSFHDGIDIGAPAGTPVRAVRDGKVVYSDTLRGYGNVVIIQHEGGYATVYAHNEENAARVGDRVRQGEVVGRVGNSGRTSGPNLHFEIRKDNVARNPIYFLPAQTALRKKDTRT